MTEDETLTLTLSDAQHLEEDLASLRALAARDEAEDVLRRMDYRAPGLRVAAMQRALVMPVLWRGDTPVAAVAHILDPVDRTLTQCFAVIGPDAPPHSRDGLVLQAMTFGMENGALFYNFGRQSARRLEGFDTLPEPTVTVLARRLATPDMRFDPICTGLALDRVRRFVDAGRGEDAIAACRQLSSLLS